MHVQHALESLVNLRVLDLRQVQEGVREQPFRRAPDRKGVMLFHLLAPSIQKKYHSLDVVFFTRRFLRGASAEAAARTGISTGG